MLQTIDRALTIYERMSQDDHNVILQANAASYDELKPLYDECAKVINDVKKMQSISLQDRLKYAADQCNDIKTRHNAIIRNANADVFVSAMLYLVFQQLDDTAGMNKHETIETFTGLCILKIYHSKNPSNVRDVINLVQTETVKSISQKSQPSKRCNIS
jgi:hypothetical protein